jgi:cytochrome P450
MLGGEGVVFVTGAQHEALRQMMAPYFSQEAVHQMLPDIQGKATHYLQTWQAQGM